MNQPIISANYPSLQVAQTGGVIVDEVQFRKLSTALRHNMVAYGFGKNELRLLLILCEETFDDNKLEGKADLAAWSLLLDMRFDKLRDGAWRDLIQCQVVDFNQGQGSYELRPDIAHWSRLRGPVLENNLRAGQELPLVAERPVDETLSLMSRETVLTEAPPFEGVQPQLAAPAGSQSSKDLGGEFKRLIKALDTNSVEIEFPQDQSADKIPVNAKENLSASGGKIRRVMAEKSAATQHPPDEAVAITAEKSAAPIAKLSFLKKAKLAISPAEKSAAALRWLRNIDKHGAMAMSLCLNQWSGLCRKDPDYVLCSLQGALERGIRLAQSEGREIVNPLGYVAKKARQDGKLGR